MPLSLRHYLPLIQALPVEEQAFSIKAHNWQPYLSTPDFLELFKGEDTICLNRRDVHDTNNISTFILKTILWGYPKGMRGQNFSKIYDSLDEVINILNQPERAKFTTKDLETIQTRCKDIKGLGLSTYSKLLYFRDFTFNGVPSLILDERLIRVFRKGLFSDFKTLEKISPYNAEKMYWDYLNLMHETSQNLNVKSENIEQFLFIFGNNLKG